ncbi:MAG: SsrA-binding protein SmpB [Myxococcales bacterium]|nr:SsrA-binding protein SmpB [Myxococcales bacterium]
MAQRQEDPDRLIVCRNRRALHDYDIEDRVEAGLVLLGTEVKSLRERRVDIKDAYAIVEHGEGWLLNLSISTWPGSKYFNHPPERRRKLLLKRRELARLGIALQQRGYTLVPLELYFNERNRAKVLLGLARGRKKYDKRQAIREREEERAARREDGA